MGRHSEVFRSLRRYEGATITFGESYMSVKQSITISFTGISGKSTEEVINVQLG